MKLLYRLYHGIPGTIRVRFVRYMEGTAKSNAVFRFVWNKLINRYHFLYGSRRGITLELTDKCNLKCTYCPKSLDIGVKGGHMDWDVLTKAIDGAVREAGVEVFNLVGFGEPFLYPRLEDAIRYIKQLNPRADIRTTSNGTLLSADLGHRLADAGLTQITISVNATSHDQYIRINASDKYETVVANTQAFLQAVNQSGKPILVIIQVLDRVNDETQIRAFHDDWAPYLGHCGIIQTQPFVNWAGQIDTQAILDAEETARREARASAHAPEEGVREVRSGTLLKELKLRKKDVDSPFDHDAGNVEEQVAPYPCYHLHRTRIISREGNALACCMVFPEEQGDLALGNIQERSFEELYKSGKIRELQNKDLNGELGEFNPCSSCNAWKTVPNIWLRNPLHGLIGRKWF